MNPKALITGVAGQTGSYLAEVLLAKGYEVHGIVRRSSNLQRLRIDHLQNNYSSGSDSSFRLHYADLADTTTIRRIIVALKPDYIYHLAGQSHVGLSFIIPESTCRDITSPTLALLEICKDLESPPRLYHASSAEVFGKPSEYPQTENTPFQPVSPYGCAKAFATQICQVYRSAYSLPVSNGILYNHESPRRAENFVTRKLCLAAASHAHGSLKTVEVGNLDSSRDWGYALEYAQGIVRMMEYPESTDFLLASGRLTTVREFALSAYRALGISLEFIGHGSDEYALNSDTGEILLKVNPQLYRPIDSASLFGDASKARLLLDWLPQYSALDLAQYMATCEYNSLLLKQAG